MNIYDPIANALSLTPLGLQDIDWSMATPFKRPPPHNKGVPMSEEQKLAISQTRKRKGLGKLSAKHLTRRFGDNNAMKNKASVDKLRATVTGRRRLYKEDGSWSWYYPS